MRFLKVSLVLPPPLFWMASTRPPLTFAADPEQDEAPPMRMASVR